MIALPKVSLPKISQMLGNWERAWLLPAPREALPLFPPTWKWGISGSSLSLFIGMRDYWYYLYARMSPLCPIVGGLLDDIYLFIPVIGWLTLNWLFWWLKSLELSVILIASGEWNARIRPSPREIELCWDAIRFSDPGIPIVYTRLLISLEFRLGLSGGCFAIQLAAVRAGLCGWVNFGGPPWGADDLLYPLERDVLLSFFPVFNMGDF